MPLAPCRKARERGVAAAAAAGLTVALLGTPPAAALTAPVAGAVSLPAGFDIRLPFVAGESVRIAAGYSPTGGSALHRNTDEPYRANDYYALDFVLPSRPSLGLGQPVLAIAAGTVTAAGWAVGGWSHYGRIVVVRHEGAPDGHTYVSLYAHLNEVTVSVGDPVAQGTTLGELGDSCDGTLSCPDFDPHLHFALYQDALGGTPSEGPYGGHACVPEPFDGYEDLVRGMNLVSHNDGEPLPACEPIPPEGSILDERGPCFERGGTPSYWHFETTAGYDGGLIWTEATAAATPDNWGRWNLTFVAAGRYTLEVYTAAAFSRSRRAGYQILHAGTTDLVRLDQTARDGWNPIGSFEFAAGDDQWVRLDDNTGEPISEHVRLSFDALRVTPAAGADADADADFGADADADAEVGSDADAEREVSAEAEGGGSADAVGTEVEPEVAVDVSVDGGPILVYVEAGCGCSVTGGAPPPVGWFLVLGAATAFRRRRARGRPFVLAKPGRRLE